jgi:addiction module HigA family antidote
VGLQKIGVPIQRFNTLINGKRACTAETTLLLSKEFGTTPKFWMNLQSSYDLFKAKIHLKAA